MRLWFGRLLMFIAGTPRRRMVFTLLPIIAVILCTSLFLIVRWHEEPKYRAFRTYGEEYRGYVCLFRAAGSYYPRIPTEDFEKVLEGSRRNLASLRNADPPPVAVPIIEQEIKYQEACNIAAREAIRHEDPDHTVDTRQESLVETWQRWKEASEAYESYRDGYEITVDIRAPFHLTYSMLYMRGVASEPDPGPDEPFIKPSNFALDAFRNRTKTHLLLVALTAFFAIIGLRLSFRTDTAWWAAPFCSWASLCPLIFAFWLSLPVFGCSHDYRIPASELRINGYETRFTLILGLGSALALQFLALILLWAGRNSLPEKVRVGPPNRTYGPPSQAEQPPPALG